MIAAITGASGFIGQHVVRRFAAAGWETRAVTRRDFEAGEAQLVRLFEGADVVVHVAGATRAPTRAGLRASNVVLTARAIDVAQRVGVGRFVFISSHAAAGPATLREQPVTESSEPSPIEAYGRSKLDAERIVQLGRELPYVVLRPAAVYGPGDRDFLAMFRLARRGFAVHPGNREQWISIIHVDDLASAVFLASTETRAAGRTFFVANDEPAQWTQLFRDAASCAGRTLMLDVQVPMPLVKLGALLGDLSARVTGRAGLLTSEKAALSVPPYWICSTERATAELGFLPAIRLQDGLRDTYHWYVTHGWL